MYTGAIGEKKKNMRNLGMINSRFYVKYVYISYNFSLKIFIVPDSDHLFCLTVIAMDCSIYRLS